MQTADLPILSRVAASIILALLAALVVGAYWPGLYGEFLFDDFANLPALGRYGGVRDLATFSWYLTSGIADPTGRPVAMLSFLIDARDWPADPFAFKRTNLAIHVCNGLLLYAALHALGRRLTLDASHARHAALLATAIWLLHPLWVSTVLYVVQRHAMLATLFALAGIRAWVASRDAFDEGRVHRGWILAVLAVPVFGLLAGLSKANGFLLPLLLAALECTVLKSGASIREAVMQTHARRARIMLIWIPAALIVAWLLNHGIQVAQADTHSRPWSLGQRLLTQPRALFDYLWHLLVPGLGATGVFADGFTASRSWLNPWTTAPALTALLAAAISSWCFRTKWPVLAGAVLFFLAGHAMESSVVMLELYFEHRNYLPATLLFWPLAWWLAAPSRYYRLRMAGGIGFMSIALLATMAQARLWSDPLNLALVWAQQNPESARAQTYAAQRERAHGRDHEAEQRLDALLERHPHEAQYALNLLEIRCDHASVSDEDLRRTAAALTHDRGLALDMTHQWLAATLLPRQEKPCSHLPTMALSKLLDAAIAGTAQRNAETESRRHRLKGHLALRNAECEKALDAFNRRIDHQKRPEFAHTQVGLLASHCDPEHGLSHLRYYSDSDAPDTTPHSPILRLRDALIRNAGYWEAEWRRLEKLLLEEQQANKPESQTS